MKAVSAPFLLGLPRIEGWHGGENLTHRVSEVVHEYGIQDRVGYIMTDNVENDDTCLGHLSSKLEFTKSYWRIPC